MDEGWRQDEKAPEKDARRDRQHKCQRAWEWTHGTELD
jgi:hypothetical protein